VPPTRRRRSTTQPRHSILILPRNRDKYTEAQLDELVPHNLRVFVFDKETWFLAKDVCSFLGIQPGDAGRALRNVDSQYVTQKRVTKRTSQITKEMYFVSEFGVYALIQKSRTVYAQ
jgi:prophage antirepressor-like protein